MTDTREPTAPVADPGAGPPERPPARFTRWLLQHRVE